MGGRPGGRAGGIKGRCEAQVLIYIDNMKNVIKQHATTLCLFVFSNHAKAHVPVFTAQNTIFGHGPGSRQNGARTAARNLRSLRRGQDDVSLNTLPQINVFAFVRSMEKCLK